MKTPRLTSLFLAAAALAAEAPPAAVEGVQGVRQEGAARVRNVDPRTARPVSPDKAEGVEQAAAAVKPVPQPGTATPPPPPPPPTGVDQGATPVKPVAGPGTASVPPPPPPPKGIDQGATAVKPVPQSGTASTPPPPPPPKGVDQGATAVKPTSGPGTASTPPPQGVDQAASAAAPVAGQGTPAPVPPPKPKGVGAVEGIQTPGGAAIHAVQGIAGIDTDKLRNLEAALQAKPAATQEGPKAKAAAQLLGKPAPSHKPPEEKTDGRSDFQERIPDKGS